MNPFDRYVGIPYRDRGRSITGCDCYGLLWLITRELRGVELPSFADGYVTTSDREAIASLIRDGIDQWELVPRGSEQTFDGVLMRGRRDLSHIGIVIAPGRLLHVDRGETSRIERYTSPPISLRVAGFYRFRGVRFL